MHEATKEKRSGESASSHLESITCVIRDLHCLNYGTRGHCSSSALRLASGAEKPYFAAIVLGNTHSFPLIQLWLLKNGVHSTRSFYWKTSRGQIFGGFFRLCFPTDAHMQMTDGRKRASVSLITASTEQLMSWNRRQQRGRGKEEGITLGLQMILIEEE